MLVNIVIPTFNREEKLKYCLASIEEAREYLNSINLYTYVYFSNKEEYERALNNPIFSKCKWLFFRYLEEPYKASTFWNKRLKEHRYDLFIYLNDDVILDKMCLKVAIDDMNKHFPKRNGVIGIRQENIPLKDACPTAFGIIGDTFAYNFPDCKVFCEDYNRFYLDSELYEYVNKHNKFFHSFGAQLTHLHPAYVKEWKEDKTHKNVRTYLSKDKKTNTIRKNKNLLWGDTFESIF